MSTVMNVLYVGATLLFLGMVYIQTMSSPPPDGLRENWPMRRLWVTEGMRKATLALCAVSALCATFVVVAGASGAELDIFVPALMLGGMVLLAVSLAGFAYSVLIYRVTRADRGGF